MRDRVHDLGPSIRVRGRGLRHPTLLAPREVTRQRHLLRLDRDRHGLAIPWTNRGALIDHEGPRAVEPGTLRGVREVEAANKQGEARERKQEGEISAANQGRKESGSAELIAARHRKTRPANGRRSRRAQRDATPRGHTAGASRGRRSCRANSTRHPPAANRRPPLARPATAV